MQRWTPACEGYLRDDILNRCNESVWLAQGADHVLITEQAPEAVPHVAMRDGTAAAEVAIQIVSAIEILAGQWIEVVGKPRVHDRSLVDPQAHSERCCGLCS